MDFKDKMHSSLGVQLIITGLLTLVEKEGYSPREAYVQLEEIKRNIWSALMEVRQEGESSDGT